MRKGVIVLIAVVATLAVLMTALVLAAPHLAFNFVFKRPKRSTKIPSYYIDTPHYKVSQAGLAVIKTLDEQHVNISSSEDGVGLHAYFYPNGEERKKFVIGVHGYRSYSRPEYAPYIEFYRSMGCNMLLPDDRAHAPSEGEYIGFGVLDRRDTVDWAKYLVKTYGEDIEIYLHGVSMGGATVLAASGEEDLPVQVKGIVADCAFTSARDILTYQFKQLHLPANAIVPRMEKICEKKAGFNFDDYAAIEQVKKAKVPILFVHGEKDTMVPVHMVDELYEACASPKKLLKVPEAAHGESIAFAPDAYYAAIEEHLGLHK